MSDHAHSEPKSLVAGDLMIVNVVTVDPHATVGSVAKLLLERSLRAVPVVDPSGTPVGMVSDGDLLGRRPEGERGSWWLKLLTCADLTDQVASAGEKKVQTVMSSPVVTVEPFTPAHEIADLFQKHRVENLPVIDGGKLVGLVNRDDLFGAVQDLLRPTDKDDESGGFRFFESLFAGKKRVSPQDRFDAERASRPKPEEHDDDVSAEEFRHLVTASQEGRAEEKAKAARAADLESDNRAKALLQTHISDDRWRALVEEAKHVAEHSGTELLLIQFPAKVCTDAGRAIGVREDGWETTLRGEPAEIFARWDKELKSKGFGLNTRVEVFEDGKVRDFGLVLTWGR